MSKNPKTNTDCQPFVISREFDAPRDVVWKAWTERDKLVQWFGPKGVTTRHAKMDFRPGGGLHYCQVTPDGKELWGKTIYREIVELEKIVWVQFFSDKDGGITRHPFSPSWPQQMLTEVTFAGRAGKTTVTIKWLPLDAAESEIQTFDGARDGMTQGWGGVFDNLANYLTNQ